MGIRSNETFDKTLEEVLDNIGNLKEARLY